MRIPSDFLLMKFYVYLKATAMSVVTKARLEEIRIMNTMSYKGNLGSVAYNEKDQVFFGKIEGINGLVNFEGESVKELTKAFHEAVDDYLDFKNALEDKVEQEVAVI